MEEITDGERKMPYGVGRKVKLLQGRMGDC